MAIFPQLFQANRMMPSDSAYSEWQWTYPFALDELQERRVGDRDRRPCLQWTQQKAATVLEASMSLNHTHSCEGRTINTIDRSFIERLLLTRRCTSVFPRVL